MQRTSMLVAGVALVLALATALRSRSTGAAQARSFAELEERLDLLGASLVGSDAQAPDGEMALPSRSRTSAAGSIAWSMRGGRSKVP